PCHADTNRRLPPDLRCLDPVDLGANSLRLPLRAPVKRRQSMLLTRELAWPPTTHEGPSSSRGASRTQRRIERDRAVLGFFARQVQAERRVAVELEGGGRQKPWPDRGMWKRSGSRDRRSSEHKSRMWACRGLWWV